MHPLIQLIILLLVVVVIPMIYRQHKQRVQWQKLYENPPRRACIQVCLPGGIENGLLRMQTFYNRIYKLCATDSQMRKQGLGSVQFVYHAQVPEEGGLPIITFLIYFDPQNKDLIKRILKQSFDSMAEVLELSSDPMLDIAQAVKPKPAVLDQPAIETAGEIPADFDPALFEEMLKEKMKQAGMGDNNV